MITAIEGSFLDHFPEGNWDKAKYLESDMGHFGI